MRKTTIACLLSMALGAHAQQTTEIKEFNLAGPFAVSAPMAFDTVDVKGKAFDPTSLLDNINLKAEPDAVWKSDLLPSLKDSRSVGVLSFYINNTDFLEAKLNVKGAKNTKLFVDGTESGPDLKLSPEHHAIAIKFLAEPCDSDSIMVSIETPREGGQAAFEYTLAKKHPYMGHDLFDGRRVRGVSLSPDGSYVCVSYQTTERDGQSQWAYELREVKSGKLIGCPSHQLRWMPRTMACLEEEREQGQRVIYKVNPLTGERQRWAAGLPDGHYTVSPTEDYIIINVEEEGTKEDADVFEVLEMDDRQPNWRKRTYLGHLAAHHLRHT